ncbi:MAG: hypothetical protein HYT70_00590 [Candidatus Aenigmarchaeota archaeon]|nr:hypothetical protein [Candidatus Aenigmarchaeota archaeon]
MCIEKEYKWRVSFSADSSASPAGSYNVVTFKLFERQVFNMSKAVAVQAVFIVGVIAITFFFIIAIFAQWIDVSNFGSKEAGCYSKRLAYCSNWIVRGQCPKWDQECEGVPTRDQCCTEVLKRASDDSKCIQARSCP